MVFVNPRDLKIWQFKRLEIETNGNLWESKHSSINRQPAHIMASLIHTFTLSTFKLLHFHTLILPYIHTFTLSYFLIVTLSYRQSATLISRSCMMGSVKTSVAAHTANRLVSRERCERKYLRIHQICLKIFYWNVFSFLSKHFSYLDLRGYRI